MMDLHKKAIPLRRGSLFDCRSSTKTAHETSTMCAVEWLQSTVYVGFDVVLPPRLSEKRAIAKLIGNSPRRTSIGVEFLRQDRQRDEHEVRRGGAVVYGVLVGM